ncbi:GAF domain-containing sensor histidine kinase [Plectonema cf. radiosum LEGE 06105]|uniref:histidine kinase n=1 Tax=Plectonema cf. radiosum LEGE 06105 TaxID=945769 RepID=A0A8J7F310_9CYAN|nr:ATP-binding protein [Plectonema radiosum]MBE9213900.1 GAF domain-containing sensor histidine kinase [Plectonema cf. radiosum LEGE 06105]
MSSINVEKFLTQKDITYLIKNIFATEKTPLYIMNSDGKVIHGEYQKELIEKYPVELFDKIFAWVVGDSRALVVSQLLSFLIKQELEKKSLAKELLERYEEIDLFDELSTQITNSLNLNQIAQLVLERISTIIECNIGVFLLLEPQTGQLQPLYQFGNISSFEFPITLGEGIISEIIKRGKGEIINNLCDSLICPTNDKPISSLICVPLKNKEEVIAAIAVASQARINYTTEDLKVLNIFAVQAAIAIEKALLYEQSLNAAKCAQQQAKELQQTLDKLQQTQAQLVHSEKMSSLGQMVAGIAHEINNPVNFIKGNIGYGFNYAQDLIDLVSLYQKNYPQPIAEIEDKIEDINFNFIKEDFIQLFNSMKVGVNRIKDIVRSLGIFSHLDKAEIKPVDIHEGIDGTLLILRHRLDGNEKRKSIEIVKEYGEIPLVSCYAGQLNQVFMNIISNAIDALQEKGNLILIRTQMIGNNWVNISIIDNGPGIAEDIQKKLYDPFFTTKEVGKGTGLGMAISYQIIVEKHGGLIKCLSELGKGTEFCIQIPIEPNPENLSKNLEI